jgi:glycosyl transferase family 4
MTSARSIKVLFLSISLPPFPESQTLRSLYLIRRLADLDFELTLVTPEFLGSGDSSLSELLPAKTKLIRTRPTRFDRNVWRLARLPGGKHWAWLYSNVCARLLVPDARAGWEKQVVEIFQTFTPEGRPDLIVSASGSCTAHVAACRLSRKFGIPWVADLGDPWSLLERVNGRQFSLLRRRNAALELATVPYARGLVFTTEEALAAYREWLGPRLPRAICIPCGYLEDVFDRSASSVAPEPSDGDRIRLACIGAAYRPERDLSPLFKALAQSEAAPNGLVKFALRVAGPHSRAFKREAAHYQLSSVQFQDRISYRDSAEMMQQSDALIIIGNKSAFQIPGKIFMCLASGRPLIYIRQRPEATDPCWRILSNFPGVLVAENSPEGFGRALGHLAESLESFKAEAKCRPHMPSLRQYESKAIGNRLAAFLAETIQE